MTPLKFLGRLLLYDGLGSKDLLSPRQGTGQSKGCNSKLYTMANTENECVCLYIYVCVKVLAQMVSV